MAQRAYRLLVGTFSLIIVAVAVHATPARAQADIEIPALVFDEADAAVPSATGTDDLDLANVVQSAARRVTTAQEAPAIVTVITGEEIRARGYKNLDAVLDAVPGWQSHTSQAQLNFPQTRGVQQAALFMHDGLSLFDPHFNTPTMWRVQPLETIKRVELITGPGGVLWGANSFLGIVNVIGKEAADIDGVEVGVAAADGNGDRESLRGYVLAGIPALFSDRSELVLHGWFESFRGPGLTLPSMLYSSPPPQPSSVSIYGPLTRAEPARSMQFGVDGKLRVGALSLAFQVPFVERHLPSSFGGIVVRDVWPEDSLEVPGMPGVLACPFEEPYVVGNDQCLDKGRTARDNQANFFERYLVGAYEHRSDDGRRGLTLRAYGVQFHRDFPHLGLLNAVPQLLEGGLAAAVDATSYRVGTSLDGDLELGHGARVLYGGELLHEWAPDNTTTSRQGAGQQTDFIAPAQLERLPLPCPREPNPASPGQARIMPGCPLTFAFESSRTVAGAYLNPQWRPTRQLILDAGARLQVAPGFASEQPYDLVSTLSGALVYQPFPDWHVKLNYAEGFRPPVFNNTASNGEAVEFDGDFDLAVETSDAVQAELNARLFKGERSLRELTLRADYSFTRLHNYITIIGNRYENTGERAIHSGEALARVYLQGGHRLELGYTFLRMATSDLGQIKGNPEHWFHLGGVFEVIPGLLEATTTLRVMAAMEDPNLLVEYRDLGYDDAGGVIDVRTGEAQMTTVEQHELVMDRLPPGAQLTLGVTVTPSERLRIAAVTYNTFNARAYRPDGFFAYEQRLDQVPNPFEDFSARVSVTCDW